MENQTDVAHIPLKIIPEPVSIYQMPTLSVKQCPFSNKGIVSVTRKGSDVLLSANGWWNNGTTGSVSN